jgi:hypothetical protein
MRRVSLVAGICAAALGTIPPALAAPLTTNEPAIFTVKVILTDASITLSPKRAARGSVVTFIVTNRGKKTHTFVIGDVKRGPGHGEGFARTLKPSQQKTVVMYLNYRGTMTYVSRSGKRTLARGVFRIR